MKTREEIDRKAAQVIRAAIRSGVLVDEERIYVRAENSPETGFCRELVPSEISYKRMEAIDAGEAFPG